MSIWKVILATIIIFAAGVVTGGLIVKGTAKKANKKPPEVNIVRMEMLRRLTRELNLNAQQRTKIHEILKDSNDRAKILRELIEPELKAEFKKAVEDIRAELTPKQRTQFDELLKQRRKSAPGDKRKQNAASTNMARASTNLIESPTNAPAL